MTALLTNRLERAIQSQAGRWMREAGKALSEGRSQDYYRCLTQAAAWIKELNTFDRDAWMDALNESQG